MDVNKEIIKLQEVSFSYGETNILSNITFSVNKGDFVGLVGQNGSGKTTLIKILLGILKKRSGKIIIFDSPIEEFKENKKIGYVPQKATNFDPFFPATVFEIVSMGLLSQKKNPKRITSADNKLINSVLTQVNMTHYKKRRIGELSGGQQQKVFIARALVSNPELLILDEPSAGIDQKSRDEFYEMLGKLNKKGMTIIMITHDLSRITKHINKVASLNTKLEFFGTHESFCHYAHTNNLHSHKEHLLCLHGEIDD